jgi:hypothetical protein
MALGNKKSGFTGLNERFSWPPDKIERTETARGKNALSMLGHHHA